MIQSFLTLGLNWQALETEICSFCVEFLMQIEIETRPREEDSSDWKPDPDFCLAVRRHFLSIKFFELSAKIRSGRHQGVPIGKIILFERASPIRYSNLLISFAYLLSFSSYYVIWPIYTGVP